MPASTPPPSRLWDIFCTVIDNYGDVGVCWRLAVNLAQRGQRVRLWVDDAAPLQWLAPQGHAGVQVLHWQKPLAAADLPAEPADVLIEAFGCALDDAVQARWAQQQASHPGLWLNLEYLSAEPYVQRCHLLTSPVMSGPAAGCHKLFFYPGFAAQTGGLLREPDLLPRQQGFDRAAWRAQWGVPAQALLISLFCYEPPALAALLQQLHQRPASAPPVHLLITQGRALQAVQAAVPPAVARELAQKQRAQWGAMTLQALPWLEQLAFDELLWASDFNFVRGEDSLVRALWAGQPFVWQPYPQDDLAHHAKLQAFLDTLQAPPVVRRWHAVWSGLQPAPLPGWPSSDWRAALLEWQGWAQQARQALWQQPDLASQLLEGVAARLAAAGGRGAASS
ncbi:MAG: elongation factor P maturation arginine rhamnosyltransferase EarP [Brachymonas sp.]|nr:elongation factor P maturation arginine rhamnosyltransferase EarP [Brachymonas sp.]